MENITFATIARRSIMPTRAGFVGVTTVRHG
jgi:hypothetical protein